MQTAMDLPTGLQLITVGAVCIQLYVSLRGRAEVAELKLWMRDELAKYKLKEDCRDEMKSHREDIDDARGFFARWQPGTHPPTDKR